MVKKERIGLQWTLWLIWQRYFKVVAWVIFLAIIIAGLAATIFNPLPYNLFALVILILAVYLFIRDMRKYSKLCKSQ